MKNKHKGKFITFEGIDKTGKSTQSQMLADHLERNNIPFIKTREPGGTDAAEAIRELVMNTDGLENTTECLLMMASRFENVYKNILPALKRGEWVICDRFNDSTLAYQGAKIMDSERDFKWLRSLTELLAAAKVNLEPDVTIYMPQSLKEKQNLADSDDIYEKRSTEYYKKVAAIYNHLAQQHKRIVSVNSIDETGKLYAPETISKYIVQKIIERTNGRERQRGN